MSGRLIVDSSPPRPFAPSIVGIVAMEEVERNINAGGTHLSNFLPEGWGSPFRSGAFIAQNDMLQLR